MFLKNWEMEAKIEIFGKDGFIFKDTFLFQLHFRKEPIYNIYKKRLEAQLEAVKSLFLRVFRIIESYVTLLTEMSRSIEAILLNILVLQNEVSTYYQYAAYKYISSLFLTCLIIRDIQNRQHDASLTSHTIRMGNPPKALRVIEKEVFNCICVITTCLQQYNSLFIGGHDPFRSGGSRGRSPPRPEVGSLRGIAPKT